MIIKIDGCAFRIGGRDNTQAVNPMLDGLSFLHYLHNFLLGFTSQRILIFLHSLFG